METNSVTHILIVEDVPTDAELIEREARLVVPDSDFVRVETQEEFLEALASFKPDIILSDYALPHFDGLRALKLALEHAPEIPFVIVTGSINEDTAVKCIKAGAWNYVIKERIQRLEPAITSGLERKHLLLEQRRNDRARRESEELFRGMVEQLVDVLFTTDDQGVITFCSPSANRMFGCLSEEMMGRRYMEFLQEDAIPVAAQAFQTVIVARHSIVNLDLMMKRKDGSLFPGELSVSALSIDGKVVGIVGSIRDITERKQAERRLQLSTEVLSILNKPVAMVDAINHVITAIKRETGFDAVGIRMQRDEDFPYFAQSGFSDDFLLAENTLIVPDKKGGVCRDKDGSVCLEGNCGLVISGHPDPTDPLFTPGGSFWTNNSSPLLDIPADQELRLHPRNLCVHEGFLSIALIPIRANQEIIGLLQLNDRKKDRFTLDMIHSFEHLASSIGLAMMKNLVEESLRESESKYRSLVETAQELVWKCDSSGRFIYLNPAWESTHGYRVDEMLGKGFGEFQRPEGFERDIKEFSRHIAGGSVKGYETTHIAKSGRELTLLFNAIPVFDSNGVITGTQGTATDITERRQAEEALKETLERLRRVPGSVIGVIVTAVESRDPYTSGHQRRVSDLAQAIGTEMGLPLQQTEGIRIAGLVHDVGKISVPAEILSTPRRLSEIEFSLIKTHSQSGYDILKEVEFDWPVAQMVYQHHERLDGSGYPRGLKGDDILPEAKIIAIADVVEAMVSHRPYRPALGIEKALEEIAGRRGVLYDPTVVDACLRLFNEKGYELCET